jgi:26S proteasome non-ATPase regulatory subunit 10
VSAMDDDDARESVLLDADDFDDVEDAGSESSSGSDDEGTDDEGTDDEGTDDEGTGESSASSSSAMSESEAEISLSRAIEIHQLPLGQIRAMIENNPELLRQRDECGCLPLHTAFSDHIRETSYVLGLVRFFLQEWPESAREYTMETDEGGGIERCLPLHLACEYYCFELRGTSPGIRVQRGAQDKAEMIRILVEAYPEAVREKQPDGKLPLDLALEHLPSLGSVQAIVRAWPDAIEESYRRGTLLLHEAVDHGAAEDVLQYLIEQRPASLREVDKNGRIALHRQGKETRIGAVRFLVNQWEDSVKARDERGRIPLHYAAADWSHEMEPNIDCIDIVRFLVEKCPESALAKDDKGKIPLHIAAACRGDPELVRSLLQACPESAQVKDNGGFLPLHCAASGWGRVHKARCLVEHWPDSIRVKTNEGWLPLHEASHSGSLPCVKYFCETWPDAVNEPSNSGWLPLHSALSCNRAVKSTQAIAVFLVGHSPDMLSHATAEGYLLLHVALGRDNCQGRYEDGLREASLNLDRPVSSTTPSALELIRYGKRRSVS